MDAVAAAADALQTATGFRPLPPGTRPAPVRHPSGTRPALARHSLGTGQTTLPTPSQTKRARGWPRPWVWAWAWGWAVNGG